MIDPILTVHELSAVFPDSNGGLARVGSRLIRGLPAGIRVCAGAIGQRQEHFPAHPGRTAAADLRGWSPFSDGEQPRIGMVFQEANLMPWRTVSENLTLPLELAGMGTAKLRRKAR